MKKNKLINQLETEINALPIPNVLEKVRQKTSIITTSNANERSRYSLSFRIIASFMVVIFFVFALYAMVTPFLNNNQYTTLTIDINPSLELTLNNKEQVISMYALNNDAVNLVNEVTILGEQIDTVIERLLNKAIELEFIKQDDDNVILFSVQNNNIARLNKIKQQVENKIDNYLMHRNIANTLIFENSNKQIKEELEQIKEHFEENTNITPAKYQYIKRILARFPNLAGHEEDLAKMSIGELNYLLNAPIANNTNLQNLINEILQNVRGNNAGGSNNGSNGIGN